MTTLEKIQRQAIAMSDEQLTEAILALQMELEYRDEQAQEVAMIKAMKWKAYMDREMDPKAYEQAGEHRAHDLPF